jgi:hypothetical protein
MDAVLKLKNIPNVLCYTFICDSAGDVTISKTKQELLDDCDKVQLLVFKKQFEQTQTPEAWAALNSKFECVAISSPEYARVTLTVKFVGTAEDLALTIAGKSGGISTAQIEVRQK